MLTFQQVIKGKTHHSQESEIWSESQQGQPKIFNIKPRQAMPYFAGLCKKARSFYLKAIHNGIQLKFLTNELSI